MIQGIDVSRYQNAPITDKDENIIGYKPLDYQKAYDAGVRWAAVRATVGNYYIDPTFKMNFEGYANLGIETHAYMVVMPRVTDNGVKITAQQHVDKLHEAIRLLALDARLKAQTNYILDCEKSRGADKWEMTALIEEIISRSVMPIIYTRAWWWDTNVLRSEEWQRNRLHVANYKVDEPLLPKDWDEWYAWQYSADGNGLGKQYGVASTSIDLNHVQETAQPDIASRIRLTLDGVTYRLVKE